MTGASLVSCRKQGKKGACGVCPPCLTKRAYRDAHREETKAKNAAYQATHKEERRVYLAARKEHTRAVHTRWYHAHRERNIALTVAYLKAHPERRRWHKFTAAARGKAREFGGTPWLPTLEKHIAFTSQPCTYCGRLEGGRDDPHVGIDRKNNSRGYDRDNIVPCCRRCNWKKKSDSCEVWARWRRDFAFTWLVEQVGVVRAQGFFLPSACNQELHQERAA